MSAPVQGATGFWKTVGLLLALLHQPKLLVLDEPTNGLDVESTRLFYDLMRGQSQHGTTILFSTHLMDQVTKLCTHAAILHHGRLVTSGAIDDLLARGPGQSLEDVFLHYTHDEANDRNVPAAPELFRQYTRPEGQ